MKLYSITLTAKEALTIPKQWTAGASNEILTLDYIPGTQLRGAFIALILKKYGQKEADAAGFIDTFLSGENTFGNALPMQDYKAGIPIPHSALTCARFRGFEQDDNEFGSLSKEKHGVCDILFNNSASELRCRAQFTDGTLCNQALKPLEGYYIGDSTLKKVRVKIRQRMSTEIEDTLGQSKPGALFSYEEILPPQAFSGYFRLHDQAVGYLMSKLPQGYLAGENFFLFIGRGKARLAAKVYESVIDSLQQNMGLRNFSNRWEEMESYSRITQFPNKISFSLTLLSDALFMDEWGMPLVSLDPERFVHRLGIAPDITLTIEKSFCKSHPVFGWHGTHNLPREIDIALTMGSAFLVTASVTSQEQIEQLKAALQKLENEGMGLRREEGFGQVVINHPFHRLMRRGG